MTMHHAISQLDAEGLVARSRGGAPSSRRQGRDRRPLALPTSWDQAVAVGDRLSTEAIVESTADVPLPDDLGMPCDGRRAAAYHFCIAPIGWTAGRSPWARSI